MWALDEYSGPNALGDLLGTVTVCNTAILYVCILDKQKDLTRVNAAGLAGWHTQ